MQQKHALAPLVPRMALVLGVFVLVTLFGAQPGSAAANSPAFVRIVHASPDIGTADVFLDGKSVLNNFAFGTITDYVAIPPGPHNVQVALIGKGPGASVITQTLVVNPGVAYTVAGLGTQPTGFSLEVFIDNNQLVTGIAKVRVYHLSPGAGSANVSARGNTVISGLTYQQASNYLTETAGSYTFTVTATQYSTALLLSETLPVNTVTSVFAIGMPNGTPQFQLKSAQVPGIPTMPQTGSDPTPEAVPGSIQLLTLWLTGALVLAVIGAGVVARRQALAHQRAKERSQ